jgi:hypothetical protein
MITSANLAKAWITLFNAKISNPMKNKEFLAKHEKITRDFKRLSPQKQAEFQAAINKALKER